MSTSVCKIAMQEKNSGGGVSTFVLRHVCVNLSSQRQVVAFFSAFAFFRKSLLRDSTESFYPVECSWILWESIPIQGFDPDGLLENRFRALGPKLF